MILSRTSYLSRVGIVSAFLFFTFLLGVKNVSAATITVDALTNTGGAGCELREAILSANTDAAVGGCTAGTSGTDSIIFSGSGTIDISNQNLPDITSQINMDGGSDIVVDAFNTSTRRIFTLSGTTSTTFGLSNMTLQNGSSTNGGCISMEDAPGRNLTMLNVDFIWCTATGDGGAVYMPTGADGRVEMLDVTFTSSSALGDGGALWAGSGVEVGVEQVVAFKNRAGGSGGAFYATSSSMTVSAGPLSVGNSTFTSNTSTSGYGGGAIFSAKTTSTIATSTFANNSVTTTLFGGGGGILLRSNRPMYASVASSIFTGNVSNYEGGGIEFSLQNGIAGGFDISDSRFQDNLALYTGGAAIFGSTSTISTVTRSLFFRNTATSQIGALEIQRGNYVISNNTFEQNHSTLFGAVLILGGAMDVFNNTLYNNSVSGTNAGVALAPFSSGGTTVRYANNIFEANYNNNGLSSCNHAGGFTVTSFGGNFFDTSSTTCRLVASDTLSATAQLGSLQDNGGPTFTRLPADNSIVVNAANSTYAPVVDQRGFARPQGAGYDSGAVDIIDDTLPVLAIVTPVSTPQGDLTPDFSFTTDEAGTLSYPGTCSSVTVQATSGTNAITFNTLTSGTRYDNCQVRLTDGSGNATTLTLTTFETTGAPGTSGGSSGGGGGLGSAGTVAIPPVTTQFQTNLQNLQNQGVSVHGLIKIPSNSAVYYIGSDGKRHAFPNDKVYFTWYENFDGVQLVNEAQLASIPLGKNVTYKPGKKMVKFTTDNKVYVVAKGGILRWVTTEAAATELYGSSWNMQIDDISDAFYTNYTFGQNVTGLMDFNPTTVQASVQFPSDSLEM